MATPLELHRLRTIALQNPDDEAAHDALGQALLTHGDDLLTWSGSGPRSHPDDAALPLHLESRLVGRLLRRVRHYVVRRGFLRMVELSPLRARDFLPLVGLPEWEGVTAVSLPAQGAWPTGLARRFVEHPVCGQLRAIDHLDLDAFQALCATDRSFERLTIDRVPSSDFGTEGPVGLRVRNLALRGDAAPRGVLRWFTLHGADVWARLEVLRLTGTALELDPATLLLRAPPSLRLVDTSEWVAAREPGGWRVELYEGSRAPGRSFVERLLATLPGLLPIANRVVVHLPARDAGERGRLEACAAGNLVVLDEPREAEACIDHSLSLMRLRLRGA